MLFRGVKRICLRAIAASVCWLCLSVAVAAQDERPRGVSVDAATRLLLAGEVLAHAAGDSRVGQASVSLDLAFLFDELEGLAARTGTLKGSADACGQGPSSLERLVRPQCLAALLISERREGRLVTEIVAQAFLRARQQLFRLLSPPSFDSAAATPENRTRLAGWWQRYGLTGLEAVARIGRENIQHRETDESKQHTLRIMRALRQVLRETAVIYLGGVIQDSTDADGLQAFAAQFRVLGDRKAKPRDHLRAAENIAALYDARLAAEMHEVVGKLPGEDCLELIPDDLYGSLQPTRSECDAAIGRIQRIVEGGKREKIVQALTGAVDERAVTLRFLLSKLNRIEGAETCGGAVAAMQRDVTPASGGLGTRRLTQMAGHLARLVKLCRPQITTAFEERAAQWLPDLCRGAQDRGTTAAQNPGTGPPEEVEIAWSGLRDAMSPEDKVVICETSGANIFSRLPGAGKPGALSAGATQALARLKSVAIAFFRGQEVSALRPVLDSVRVPRRTDGTVRHVEILRTLCRLSPPDADDGIEARVVSALFRDLGLSGETSLGTMCGLLLRSREIATLDALLDAIDPLTIEDGDAAETVRSTLRERVAAAVGGVDARSHEIAHRVSAVGRVAQFARDAEKVVPLGPEDSGCTGNARGRGLGAGLKISALEPRLDLSEPERWTATLAGRVTLVICGANGAKGLRRVFSIRDLSADLTLALTLDDRTMPTARNGVPEQWSTALKEKTDEAFRKIAVSGDALRQELVENLPALLQAAGLDLAALVIVKSALASRSDGLDVRYGADTGILLAIDVPLQAKNKLDRPDRVRICVAIPLSASPSATASGCDPAKEVGAVADRMVKAVFSPLFEQFVRRIGRDLDLADSKIAELLSAVFRAPTGSKSEDGSFLKEYFGVGLNTPVNGKRTHKLRLRIPESIVLRELEKAGLAAAGSKHPPLTGDLEVSLGPDPSGTLTLGEASLPSLNPRYLLARILPKGGLDTGFLSVSPVASKGSEGPCGGEPKLRLALGSEAPLAGTLGFVCFVRHKGELSARFVPDKEGSLSSRDGSWVFSYRSRERGDVVKNRTIELDMKVTSDDPRFQRFSGEWATVRFNLGTGSWELPPDGDHNREIYSRIEQGASDLLPRGVRIRNLRIGSKGVEVSFDPAEAAGHALQQVWHALRDGKIEASKAKPDQKRGCDLEKIYWLSRLVYEGEVPKSLSNTTCEEDPGLDDAAEPIQGLAVKWKCAAEDSKPGTEVDECSIVFPKELSFCSKPVRLLVEWEGGNPILKADQARKCLKSRIESLLPGKLASSVDIENPKFKLIGECPKDPQSCGIAADIQVDLSPLIADLETAVDDLSKHIGAGSDSCPFDDETKLSLRGVMTFEGAVRLESGGAALLEGAKTNLRRCAQALTGAAARAAARKVAERMKDEIQPDEIFEIAAKAARGSLEGLRTALDIGSDGKEATCHLRLREGDDLACEELTGTHLKEETVAGVRLTRTIEMADLAFTLRLDSGWKTPAVGDVVDPTKILDGAQPRELVGSAFADAFKAWSEEIDPKVTVGCKDVAADAGCLQSLSAEIKRIAGSVGGGMVSYEDGASLTQKGKKFTLRVPLRVKVPVLERESQVSLTCILDATKWWKPTVGKCGTDTDLESLLVGILTDELGERLEKKTFELGPLSYKVEKVEPETTSADKFRIEGVANLSAIEIAELKKLDLAIVFDARWKPRIEADLKEFTDSLTGDLKDAVNDVIGNAIPLKIEKITVADKTDLGLPTALAIESTADIAGLFSISAPKLVLSSSGFRIEGPNRLAISFPEGLTIPVSPFAICPTGGGLEDTKLTVTANITLAECTASHLLKYQGQLAIDIKKPGRVETDGSLTLLGLIPLGSNEGVLDLSEPMMRMNAEIGGVAKDIVEVKGEFLISGDPILAKAESDVALFRVPVGEGHFKLDLTTGQLDMAVRADLGFATGQGHVDTQRRFSRPRAKIDTRMDIGGFPLFGGDIEARPRLAKVGLTVFGIRFGAAVPGLDALSASALLEILKRFLNLGFEDLERALEAILSGNFLLNPFSDFGSGGDGMGGDGDGEHGESGREKPGDADREGIDEEPETVGDPPEHGEPLPAAGEIGGGPLNQAAMPLWFQRPENTDRVHIGVGVKGTPDEKLVAVAQYDPNHFDPDGLRLGVTMTVHDYGYSQILTRSIAGSGGCPAETGGVVYLYRGKDVPRRGYYELCRVAGPNGHLTVERLEEFDAETRVDLAVLNAALLAELAERSSLSTEARVLRRGRLLTAANGSLRGGVAFQRPGELLVAMRGRFDEKRAACGTAARVDVSDGSNDWSGPRIFWITGLGEKDPDNDDLILQTVAALWGCPQGALARIDRETGLLTTGRTVSVRSPGAAGFASIGDIKLPTPREDRAPQWVGDFSKDLEKAVERTKRENQRMLEKAALDEALGERSPGGGAASLCIENCGAAPSIEMRRVGGLCEIRVDGAMSARVPPAVYGGNNCEESPDHTWLTITRGGYLTAITHGLAAGSTAGLRIGAFVSDQSRSGVTDRLNDIAKDGLSIDEYHLIRGFLRHAVASEWPGAMLKMTRFAGHPAGSLALVAKRPGHPSKFHWYVRNRAREHAFEQTGVELSDMQRSALLPLLTEAPKQAEALNTAEAGTTLWLRFEQHLRLYAWNGDTESWAMLLELNRPDGPLRDAYEAVVREGILDRLGNGLDRKGGPYHATVFPHVQGASHCRAPDIRNKKRMN